MVVLPVLGRLYVEAGQPLLAERCLAAARSHDPGSPATWEAMGSLAALSPQGERFFPTPITMVLKKTSQRLKIVSALSQTVLPVSQAGGLPASQSASPKSDFQILQGSHALSVSSVCSNFFGPVWAGAEERGAIYEQAMKLGGGSEALLGFVEGTLGAGRPCSGTVYAAARRCVKDFRNHNHGLIMQASALFFLACTRLWARLHLAYFWAKILNRPAWS